MTGPTDPAGGGSTGESGPASRPADVDTGFWLWVVAVPLMVTGQLADAYGAARDAGSSFVFITTAIMAAVIAGVVVGLLALMRSGHRWARTLLTGGGITTIVFTLSSLLSTPRPPVPAVVFAVTGIFGAVFIAGGVFLLHRADSNRFFTR